MMSKHGNCSKTYNGVVCVGDSYYILAVKFCLLSISWKEKGGIEKIMNGQYLILQNIN